MNESQAADVAFAQVLQQATDAFAALAANEGELNELISSDMLTPAIVGQVLMCALPYCNETLAPKQAQFWVEVTAYLGPDWVQSLKSMATFASTVDGWKV